MWGKRFCRVCKACVREPFSQNDGNPGRCFENDSALRDVEIPEGITEIGILAFSQCGKIERLELPPGVRIVSNYAFMDCVSLKTVYLPMSLSHMSLSVFSGCPNSVTLVGWDDTYGADFAKDTALSSAV